jgi:aminopeptidase YwaD
MMRFTYFVTGVILSISNWQVLYSQSINRPEITADDIKAHIHYLASDLLGGRYTGSSGSYKAANYIRGQFRDAGLKLLGDDGFQEFEIIDSLKEGENNSFTYNGRHAILGIDFAPVYGSKSATINSTVVFAGYGFDIRQDGLVWCDYDGIDVKGKWVMVFRGLPESQQQENPFSPFAKSDDKILLAMSKGAAGIIFIDNKESDFNEDDPIAPYFAQELMFDFPAIRIKRALADNILKVDGWEVDRLESLLLVEMKPYSMELSTPVAVTTEVIQKNIKARNIVGLLEGSDPVLKDSYIIVGAHYDHLGLNVSSDSSSLEYDSLFIHNGADDNASGTAGILELAAMLANERSALKRSIVFIAFDGEEHYLRGSQHFISDPLIDLNKVVAMINLDMIGRLDKDNPVLLAGGIGTAAESEQILSSLDTTAVKLKFFPEKEVYSDDASFYEGNIPVFYFTSGMHEDYHTPNDDWDRINYEGEKDILEMSKQLILHLANMEEPLTYQTSGQ